MSNAIDNLAEAFSRLPGVGKKSAYRIAYHLVSAKKDYNQYLADSISTIKDKIHICSVCGSYTETDPCSVCNDASRDRNLLCIVEQPQDVITIQGSGAYNGLFHVLGGAIDLLHGITPKELGFDSLMKRIESGSFTEIIIATNPTESGDITASYIRNLLKNHSEIKLSRLASGLPIGGELEYVSTSTLARSLRGRIDF